MWQPLGEPQPGAELCGLGGVGVNCNESSYPNRSRTRESSGNAELIGCESPNSHEFGYGKVIPLEHAELWRVQILCLRVSTLPPKGRSRQQQVASKPPRSAMTAPVWVEVARHGSFQWRFSALSRRVHFWYGSALLPTIVSKPLHRSNHRASGNCTRRRTRSWL
jgi:hypothetical protein